MLVIELMSIQLNSSEVGLKVPTQSAPNGAKTTRPVEVTVAPLNFWSVLIVELMSMQLKTFVAVLKVPTQSAFLGENITRSFMTVAPLNFRLPGKE